MDRRTFLATPLVFGFRELFAQDNQPVVEPKVEDWFGAALKKMKETDRYGVVLVVPTEERARQSVGLVLNRLLTEDPAGAHQLFAGAVFVCMTAALADGRVRKSGEGENRLLLAPDGKRIAADEMAWPTVGKSGTAAGTLTEIVEGLRTFVHGKKGERLAEHAARIEKRLTDEVRAALRALDSEDFEERSKASTVVTKNAAGMVPYLIRVAATDESLERRWRAGAAVKEVFATTGKLPFGCASKLEYFDPCPGCGLGSAPGPSRHFLRFLSS